MVVSEEFTLLINYYQVSYNHPQYILRVEGEENVQIIEIKKYEGNKSEFYAWISDENNILSTDYDSGSFQKIIDILKIAYMGDSNILKNNKFFVYNLV